MTEARGSLLALLMAVGLGGVFLCQLTSRYRSPHPPLLETLTSAENTLEDAGGIVLGLRRLAADLAWIQTLQYYGTPENDPEHDHGESEHAHTYSRGGSYPRFLDMCRRVAQLDPYFTYAYIYGGSVLGWNLNRLDEAEVFLREGIANNPTEWRLPQYLAGLAYQKDHDVPKLIEFLESIIQDPQCPLMVKALLANIYKKQHLFDKALKLWEIIHASGDPEYQGRAEEQTREIYRIRAELKRRPA